MSRNQTGGTELIPMPHPTGAAQLSLPIILYSALQVEGHLECSRGAGAVNRMNKGMCMAVSGKEEHNIV